MNTTSSPEIKVAFLGDSGVGKTSLGNRLIGIDELTESPTVGAAFFRLFGKTSDGDDYEVALWDTAGQERYRALTPMYFQNSKLIILVYDISSVTSFEHIKSWWDLAKEKVSDTTKFLLIGNKTDLLTREITHEQGSEKAESIGANFIETSALDGTGISLIWGEFEKMAKSITSIAEASRSLLPAEASNSGCSC